LVFNRYHQLNTVEKVGPKIVRKVRLACDRRNVNAELFSDENANVIDGKTSKASPLEAVSNYRLS